MNWLFIVSFGIYTFVLTGFRVGTLVLASRWVKGEWAELIFWSLFGTSTVVFVFVPAVGQWMLLILFALFNFGQFLEAAFIEFQSVDFTDFRAVLYLPTKAGITPLPVLMNTAS